MIDNFKVKAINVVQRRKESIDYFSKFDNTCEETYPKSYSKLRRCNNAW